MIKPIRKGRFSYLHDWHLQYHALLTTADTVVECIRDGDIIAMTASANWPYAFDAALTKYLKEKRKHIEVKTLNLMPDTQLFAKKNAGLAGINSNFYFPGERQLQSVNRVDYVPTHLSATDAWICSCNPRVAVISCSPPDKDGWMSRSIWGAEIHRRVLEQAEVVIVEVNDKLPYFHSEGESNMLFHVSEADAIVENSHNLLEIQPVAADSLDRKIAGNIAELVDNGACMQFGLGSLSNAIGESLVYAGKKDLGVQTEVISNCVVNLIKHGIVNNSQKQIYPGYTVGAYFVGDQRLWDFAKENRSFCQKEISWTNDARRIALNNRVISINNAIEIDLTGQVNAESIGYRQYSGTGGQLEWVLGAQWSAGGKSILALRSSYLDKNGQLHSKIVPNLAAGTVITTPRTCVQYVATEYGVVNLQYKSLLERARALISIAHPDFRQDLIKAIKL